MQLVNEYDLSFRKGDSGPKYLFRGPNIDWGVLLLKPGQTLGKHSGYLKTCKDMEDIK